MRFDAGFVVVLALLGSCDDPIRPDRTAPELSVVFPNGSMHDADGDGLVDLELRWSRDVDLESVRVTALDGLNNDLEGSVELLDLWGVVRFDSIGITLRESVEHLMRRGASRIEVAASDRAGNESSVIVEITLPPMTLHRTIALGAGRIPYDMVHCADDDLLYISGSPELTVVHGSDFEVVDQIPINAARIRCPPGMPFLLYSGRDHGAWNRATASGTSTFSNTSGIAWSPLSPTKFFGGSTGFLYNSVDIYSIDPVVYERSIDIPPPPQGTEFNIALAVSEASGRMYVSNTTNGVRALDFVSGAALDYLSLPSGHGFVAYDLRTSPAGGEYLYAAVTDGVLRGLAVFRAHEDTAYTMALTEGRPIRMDVSPSGRLVFMTTQVTGAAGAAATTPNYLIAVPEAEIVQEFPRENDTGDTRLDSAVGFRSDGRVLFTAYDLYKGGVHEAWLQVYLNREPRPSQ